jgi:hypothetical protein
MALACLVGAAVVVPRWLCGREADRYFDAEVATQSPPDVAAVAGSVGLHARVTGTDRQALLRGGTLGNALLLAMLTARQP